MISNPQAHNVRTADNVVLGMTVAGIASRTFALLIDFLLFAVIAMLLFFAVNAVLGAIFPNLDTGYFVLIIVSSITLFETAYFTFCEGLTGGRTPGKRALGLRVVNTDGSQIGLITSLIRNTIRILDVGLFFFTVPWMFFDHKSRRLGDYAAGTLVIRERTAVSRSHAYFGAPAQRAPQVAGESGLLIVGLDRLSGRELGALRTFFARYGVHPAQRQRIAASLRTRLADKLGLAADAPERAEDPESFLRRLYLQLDSQQLP